MDEVVVLGPNWPTIALLAEMGLAGLQVTILVLGLQRWFTTGWRFWEYLAIAFLALLCRRLLRLGIYLGLVVAGHWEILLVCSYVSTLGILGAMCEAWRRGAIRDPIPPDPLVSLRRLTEDLTRR